MTKTITVFENIKNVYIVLFLNYHTLTELNDLLTNRKNIMNKAKYTYDYEMDVVNIEAVREYEHACTVDLTFGIFLDFDKNLLPANLEIITASEVVGVEKESLISPEVEVSISVGDNVIEAEITFNFEEKNETLKLKALNEGFPASKSSFALAYICHA